MTIRKTFFFIALSVFLLTPLTSHAGVKPCGVEGAIPMQVYIPFITAEGPEPHDRGEKTERPCYYLKPFTGDTKKGEGLGDTDASPDASGNKDTSPDAGELADYIAGLYTFALSIGGMIAMVMIIVGGFQWMMAGGNAQGIGKAKKKITNASLGLVLLLFSYTILKTINPSLVTFGTIISGEASEISFTPRTQPKLSAEKIADSFVDTNMRRNPGMTRIQAQKKTVLDAVTDSERMMVGVIQAYKDVNPQVIEQLIDDMEQQKNLVAGTVTNVQKEIDRIKDEITYAMSDFEKNTYIADLQEAQTLHDYAVRAEISLTNTIIDATYRKMCAGYSIQSHVRDTLHCP